MRTEWLHELGVSGRPTWQGSVRQTVFRILRASRNCLKGHLARWCGICEGIALSHIASVTTSSFRPKAIKAVPHSFARNV